MRFIFMMQKCSLYISFHLLQLNQVDRCGQCPLVHAAINDQLDATSLLLQCDWTTCQDQHPSRNEALQQALVAAASRGHTVVSGCWVVNMSAYYLG